MQSALGGDIAVSNPILSPDRFRDTFRENPEHLLYAIRSLGGASLPGDYLSDPTLRPVIFEKWGQYFIGLIKVGYARDMLHLEYRPLGASNESNVCPRPSQSRLPWCSTGSPSPPASSPWVAISAATSMALDDEQPQHRVLLPEFRIARVPVTVAQFRAFVNETNYRTTAEEEGSARIVDGFKVGET